MSGVVDVGEAFELTFQAAPGANVTASFLDPMQDTVIDNEYVPEVPANSGKFPKTFVPTDAGMWTVWFHGPGQPERYYIRAASLTGPPPYAAVADVAIQFVPGGTLTAAQEGLTQHLVVAASAKLRHHARLLGIDIDGGIRTGSIDPDVAALAVSNMVLRVLRNPEGLRAKTVGPFSRTYDTSAAAGLIVVTDDDLSGVTPTGPTDGPTSLGALGIGTVTIQAGMMPPYRPPYRNVRYGGW